MRPRLMLVVLLALVAAVPHAAQAQGPSLGALLLGALQSAGSTAIEDITFDTLKFDIDKGEPFVRSMLPESIERLLGRNIRIRGYILPSFQQHGITQFVLVRDNMECCFGPGAALYDCILVEMKPGKSADYTVRPVAVEGAFSLREFLDADGKHLAIYHLEGESVR